MIKETCDFLSDRCSTSVTTFSFFGVADLMKEKLQRFKFFMWPNKQMLFENYTYRYHSLVVTFQNINWT